MGGLRSTLQNRLEARILLLILAVLFCGFGGLYYFLSNRIEKAAVSQVQDKSEMLASAIHRTLDRSMVNFRADIARHILDDLKDIEGMARIQIIRGKTGGGREEAFQDFVTLEDVKTRVPGGLRAVWMADHPKKMINVAEGIDSREFKAAFQSYLRDPQQGDTYYFEEISGRRVMTYLRPFPNFERCFMCHGSDHPLRGVLMISTLMDETDVDIAMQKRSLFSISLGTLVMTGFILKFSLSRSIVVPLKKISDRIHEIAEGEGDLSKRVEIGNEDEVGRLAIGFNQFGEKLSELVSEVGQTGRKISATSSVIMAETRDMAAGAEIQTKAAEASSVSIAQMNNRIKDVAVFSESLADTSRESSDALEQITDAIVDVTRNTTILSQSVEGTATSISAMSSSIKDINESVETLLKEVKVTSSSMTEMDRFLREMRENIVETVSLSQEARNNAEMGKKTVSLTTEGMDRIKAYADEVTRVIRNLQRKTERIGKFLNVIDDVSEQTNLLALNAAIIASKAGRHGKGFGIVSNEIKELSDRTASSTHEIHAIINDLQSEGKIAVETIETGNKRIEEGVEFSKSAHKALTRIMESFERTTERTDFVAKVAREQSSGVKRAIDSMERVKGMVSRIASATHGQNKESESMIDATDQIRVIARELETVMKSQSKWMEKVKERVKDGSDQAERIANATSDQNRQSGDMIRAIEQIKRVTHATEEATKKVSSAVKELTKQIEALEGNISRFKV